MDMASYITQMATSMRAIGSMTKQMVTEPTLMLMAPSMSDRGRTISNMDLALKHGLTMLFMKVNTMKERKMETESSRLLMAQSTTENFK